MRNEIKIKAVILGGILFFGTILMMQITAAGIPVSLSYQITLTSELTDEFNATINTLSFRDEDGDWKSVQGGDSEKSSQVTELSIDSVKKIQFNIADTSVGSGRLENAVTLPPENIEIPVDLNLNPYQELMIEVEIIADDNLYELNEGTYLYKPHLVLNISGKRMSNNNPSELLLRTEIHQNEEGIVMYGPPIETGLMDESATGTESIQAE